MPLGGPGGSRVDLGARCVVPAKPWPTEPLAARRPCLIKQPRTELITFFKIRGEKTKQS